MRVPTEAAVMLDFMQDLEARQNQQGFTGLDTGFEHLNHVLGGLKAKLYVLGAPPSCGKTTYVKQLSDQIVQKNKVPALFFSFEQSAEELRIKSLSRLGKVNNQDIAEGRVDKVDQVEGVGPVKIWDRVREAAATYRDFGSLIRIVEANASTTIDNMRKLVEAAKDEAGAERALIMIDYMQIVPVGNSPRLATAKDRVDWLCSELRRMARDLHSPVVAISSLNRDAYRDGAKPTLASFKESGGIEFSADVAAALWTDKDKTAGFSKRGTPKKPDHRRVVSLCILKHRGGELGEIGMVYQPEFDLFTEKERQLKPYTDSFQGGQQ
jgi:replicative DNA helicase